jgi:hypothetical protein
MNKKNNLPNTFEICGSFNAVGGIDNAAYLAGAEEGAPNLDNVITAVAAYNWRSKRQDIPIAITYAADIAAAAAELEVTWTNAPGDPTTLAFAAPGVAGNAWRVTMYDVGPVGAGNEVVAEDPVLEICYVGIDVGASTIGDVEAAITALGGNIAVGAASTTPLALAAAADCFAPTLLTGGLGVVSIDVTGSDEAGYDYVIHFEPAVATVGDVNTAVNLTAHIQVPAGGVGTVGNVLQVGDAIPRTLMRSPYPTEVEGTGFLVFRAALGAYQIMVERAYAKDVISFNAGLSMTAENDRYVVPGPALVVLPVGTMCGVFVRSVAGGAVDLNAANAERVNFKLLVKRT